MRSRKFILIIIFSIFSILLVISLTYFKKKKLDKNVNSPESGSEMDWKEYTSEKYSIKYPPNYLLAESHPELVDPKVEPRDGLIEIISNAPSNISEIYSFFISWDENNNDSIENIIKKTTSISCNFLESYESKIYILDDVEGLIFKDTKCSSRDHLSTYIYLINKGDYFRIVISSKYSYSELQTEVDKILSSFRFSDS